MINEDKWENSKNQNMRFFDEWLLYHFCLSPPYGNIRKIEKCQSINFDDCSKYILVNPFPIKEYNLFTQNTERSLEQ